MDVSHVGYPVLFGLIAIESMGIPVPGETALITAGVLASRGDLSIELVIVLAAVAGALGDNVGYLIGRVGGRRLLERPGPFHEHRLKVIHHGEPFFATHGPKAVFLGRWFAGLRIAAAWLAGMNHMHWPTFLLWNALGGIVWATAVGLAAYIAGHAVEKALRTAGGRRGAVVAGGALAAPAGGRVL